MRRYLRDTFTVLTVAMVLSCGESTAPEYGTLVVSPAMVVGLWDEVDSVRLLIEPGNIDTTIGARDTSFTFELQLGLYNVSVYALGPDGDTVYAGDSLEVLVEPYETVALTIELLPRYPATAPVFADLAPTNVNNNGTYTISWHPVDAATGYRLQRDTLGTFATAETVYDGIDTSYLCEGMADGTYSYRVVALNDVGQSPWSEPVVFAVTLVDTLRIATSALSGGVVGLTYTDSICLSGGKTPFAWALDSGRVPPGLDTTWGACLTVSGVADSAGAFAFIVSVADSAIPQQHTARRFTMTMVEPGAPLVIDTDSLPAGTLGVAFNAGVCASGGVPPYAWAITAGSLPTGVETNAGGCLNITGTPTDTGTFTCTVRAIDSDTAADTTTQAFTVRIAPAPLRITDLSVPACTAGIAGEAFAVAQGGSGDLVWRVTDGSLPGGLALLDSTADTVRIAGVATDTGTFAFTLRVVDRFYPRTSDSIAVSIAVAARPVLTVSGRPLDGATIGVVYNDTLCVAGGAPPYKWALVQRELPTGLTLAAADSDTACVTIAGEPTVADTFACVLRIADAHVPAQTVELPCTVVVLPPPLHITTGDTLPDAMIDSTYRTVLATGGGSGRVIWTLLSGQVPPGCGLSVATVADTAVIEGMPTDTGTYAFTVAVADSEYTAMTDTVTCVVRVVPNPRLRIVTDSLPSSFANENYDTMVCALGGVGPFDWTIAAGAMPQGIDFDFAYPDNRCIGLVGMPILDGSWDFTIRVTDSNVPQDTAYHAYSITVAPARVQMLTQPPLVEATRLEPYHLGLESINGDEAAHVWSILEGTLPPGLSLRDLGAAYWVIDGTPTDSGSYAFTLEVRDTTNHQADTTAFELTVLPGVVLEITTTALAPGVLNAPYDGRIEATTTRFDGTGAWRYEWVSGTLPAGVSFVPDWGDNIAAVRGTPTEYGTFTFAVRAVDTANPLVADTVSYDLLIYNNAGMEILTASLPPCTVGIAYPDSICVEGGTPPYTWQIVEGSLPDGLSLDERFVDNLCIGFAGVPTATAFRAFRILVTDSDPVATQGVTTFFTLQSVNP